MDKTKTIPRIWEQSERIIDYLKSTGRTESVRKIERIASHYSCNMVDWMKTFMDLCELDAYYRDTPVPINVYKRPLPRPYRTFQIVVHFDDGDMLSTPFNAHDKNEVEEYYIGKQFTYGKDCGDGFQEFSHTAVKVEFQNNTY